MPADAQGAHRARSDWRAGSALAPHAASAPIETSVSASNPDSASRLPLASHLGWPTLGSMRALVAGLAHVTRGVSLAEFHGATGRALVSMGENMKTRMAQLILLVIVVSISVFVFFKSFSLQDFPPFAKEILAALLGSVLTISITAVLLRYQTSSELDRDKSVAVFQEKLKMYEGFCSALCEIATDGRMKEGQEQVLRLWAMRLSLVSGQEVSEAIDHFFLQTHRYGTLHYELLSGPQRDDLLQWHRGLYGKSRTVKEPRHCFMSIGALIAHLKHDLGEVEVSNLKDVASARHAVDDILRVDQPA